MKKEALLKKIKNIESTIEKRQIRLENSKKVLVKLKEKLTKAK